ncbi:GNAT family N-acetyltransferase [Terrabacter terrigena]|uniref:GNAT family N-acetyltransferase n=1 Tax=Terrabacter terrigena TaxID=574718 RepID=A0ABW3MQB2_9MICO
MIANREDELEGTDMGATPEQHGREAQADSDGVVVRGAVGDDLAGVVSVGHRTWRATYEPIAGPEYVAMGLAKWWTSDVVSRSIRKGHTLVAEKDGEVIGVATFGAQDDDLVLWKLYVLPGHHGQGTGSRLMAAVVARAREDGHRRITLSHLEGNEQAARFYARHGFVVTHREEGGSGLPASVWMARDLDPGHSDPDGASA